MSIKGPLSPQAPFVTGTPMQSVGAVLQARARRTKRQCIRILPCTTCMHALPVPHIDSQSILHIYIYLLGGAVPPSSSVGRTRRLVLVWTHSSARTLSGVPPTSIESAKSAS